MNEIRQLLKEVALISLKYEQIAKITGENFNVFQILGLQSDEVRLHSAFLAELLNPKGSHGQGDLYLRFFINQIKLKKEVTFDTISAQAFVEYHTIKITEDGENGGRIDILIKDKYGRHIIVENKIYAGDQPKQLSRYNKFDPSAILLYLNLNGTMPSNESSGELTNGEHYHIISYKTEILEWLSLCMKESVTLPIIRETIHQYINLIKKLTNQTTFNSMNMEIKDLLAEKEEYFNNVSKITTAFEDLKNEIRETFFKILENELRSPKYSLHLNVRDLEIQLHAGEDANGFFFAYRIAPASNMNRCRYSTESTKEMVNKVVSKKSKNDEDLSLMSKCTNIISKIHNHGIKSSDYSIGWYRPSIFGKDKQLHQIDYKKYISLRKEDNCRLFIDELLTEALIYIEKIRAVI
ncbi:MAG: PD-(D/E)XK nuclease family protein [Breznakibacter sp.]|nr:PD-(D/E)XK nuclease family protein [Breznakibacter sp.]